MSLQKCLDYILQVEGDFNSIYVTKHGVNLAMLTKFIGKPATEDDVKKVNPVQAAAIYENYFYDPLKLKLISNDNIALVIFEQAVLTSNSLAIKMVQQILNDIFKKNLAIDGDMGPTTALALNSISPTDFVREYIQLSQMFYIDLVQRDPIQTHYLASWISRTHKLQDFILTNSFVSPSQVAKPDTTPAVVPSGPMGPYHWAIKQMGNKEVWGSKHNPRIIWYHSFTSLGAKDDETPWCSSFMCAAAESNGFKSTKSAAARSWLGYGSQGDGSKGDIAVLSRSGGNHVAFIHEPYKKGDSNLILLGGNQDNNVSIKKYSATNLLQIRRFKV